jgi:hypothetical protein
VRDTFVARFVAQGHTMAPKPDGPMDFYSTVRPAAPSQLRNIVALACSLFDEPFPTNRYEASILIARMKLAIENDPTTTTAKPADDCPF